MSETTPAAPAATPTTLDVVYVPNPGEGPEPKHIGGAWGIVLVPGRTYTMPTARATSLMAEVSQVRAVAAIEAAATAEQAAEAEAAEATEKQKLEADGHAAAHAAHEQAVEQLVAEDHITHDQAETIIEGEGN